MMPDDATFCNSKPVKPAALTVNPSGIPDKLKSLKQWCCWRYAMKDGRWKKPPMQPDGKAAKSNDPATWATFDAALTAYQTGKYDGIGLFVAGQLTGVDLDHCIDDDRINDAAMEILGKFAGYAEKSPSGTGLRIFCTGKPQRSGKGNGADKWIEVYAEPSSRFLTVTGAVVRDAKVKAEQTALDWLYARYMVKPAKQEKPTPHHCVNPSNLNDATLLEKAAKADSGAKFQALWAGDTSGYSSDSSAADLALCGMLAYWTAGDVDRIDRLFRQSGLMRDKWDSQRGETTYGALTIEKAVADCTQVYSGRKPATAETGKPGKVYTVGGDATGAGVELDLEPPLWATRQPGDDDEPVNVSRETERDNSRGTDEAVEPPSAPGRSIPARFTLIEDFCALPPSENWLVENYLEPDSLAILYGDSETYKSFLAIDLACHIATGTAWNGNDVKQGTVLYIAGEGGNGLKKRFKAWFERYQLPMQNIVVSTVPVYMCEPAQTTILISDILALIESLPVKPVFIVMDTVNTHFGGDENSTQDMTRFVAGMREIRIATKSNVLGIHHCGHGDKSRARGSIVLRSGIDWEYRMEQPKPDKLKTVHLTCTKSKDADKPRVLAFEPESQPLPWATAKGEPMNSLVLIPTDLVEPDEPETTLRGKPATALRALEALYQAERERLTVAGNDPATARVALEVWQAELTTVEPDRKNRPRLKTTLIDRGFITISDGFVYVTNR